jgi:hypothetical protein
LADKKKGEIFFFRPCPAFFYYFFFFFVYILCILLRIKAAVTPGSRFLDISKCADFVGAAHDCGCSITFYNRRRLRDVAGLPQGERMLVSLFVIYMFIYVQTSTIAADRKSVSPAPLNDLLFVSCCLCCAVCHAQRELKHRRGQLGDTGGFVSRVLGGPGGRVAPPMGAAASQQNYQVADPQNQQQQQHHQQHHQQHQQQQHIPGGYQPQPQQQQQQQARGGSLPPIRGR